MILNTNKLIVIGGGVGNKNNITHIGRLTMFTLFCLCFNFLYKFAAKLKNCSNSTQLLYKQYLCTTSNFVQKIKQFLKKILKKIRPLYV